MSTKKHTPGQEQYFIATVHLLFNATSQAEACDCVSAMLTENLMQQPDTLKDWCYLVPNFPEPEEIKVPSDWADPADWYNNSEQVALIAAAPETAKERDELREKWASINRDNFKLKNERDQLGKNANTLEAIANEAIADKSKLKVLNSELLEALKKVKPVLDDLSLDAEGQVREYEIACGIINTAIAKAEGRSDAN